MKTNLNAWKLAHKIYGQTEFYTLAHTIDAYTKTLFQDVLNRYSEDFRKVDSARFRTPRDISRLIFGLDPYYSGKADREIIRKPGFWQKHVHKSADYHWKCYCGSEDEKTRKEILRFEPELFCINADSHSTEETKEAARTFYEELFPQASKFELP